jgi:Tfp pilus assembly protein PilO
MPKLSLPKLPKRENAVPRSQIERLWLVAGGLIAFVMLLIGYFFFISPQRSSTADVDSQAATVQQQNAVLQAKLDALREQNKNLDKYQADLAALHQALPSTSATSDFLRTLQSLGAATLTEVTDLTVGQPVPVTPMLAAAAPTPSAAPSAGNESAAPTAPVIAAPSAYALPITANVTGTTTGLAKFLDQLQAVQPRAVLISAITETGLTSSENPGGGETFTLQMTMQAFVAPTSEAESAQLASAAAGK